MPPTVVEDGWRRAARRSARARSRPPPRAHRAEPAAKPCHRRADARVHALRPDCRPLAVGGAMLPVCSLPGVFSEGRLDEGTALLLQHLPLLPTGTEALQPFGYDLFAGTTSTFAPATDIPVPSEYIVGPGDAIEVQLTGNTKGRYSLVVGRDGLIYFPDLGPIAVSGQRFPASSWCSVRNSRSKYTSQIPV